MNAWGSRATSTAGGLGVMKPRLIFVSLVTMLAIAGCDRNESQPPPAVDDLALERRVQAFGQTATAADIAWRSSGLGIRIITPGEGSAPKMTDVVRVHYTGRLKDGTVFDDSRARGKPQDFVVNRLITGWAAAMSSLQPGGRAEIFIPPKLGYGGMKVAGVPPNSGLIFDVELLAVNP
ncbi:FKBP-type peptidyl-prolyl cis-trans isomerase [Opitutus terrae]|uniref:Peptidyl-prolyl cis-trans isomerase n=1 Tax=Opitutus terrae (strain DSM 11246 / JCM 15787 / PB90-1) TaxID=452637 RepID=B1ZNU8_OPITP|nr:FKBP-type peptidyl-prolyl cis-trans isomerase [Opitutus terrae]ACB75468.1 peptidylprolyl isomerase FKBP-type [Opitutus terrae PB90-1]